MRLRRSGERSAVNLASVRVAHEVCEAEAIVLLLTLTSVLGGRGRGGFVGGHLLH